MAYTTIDDPSAHFQTMIFTGDLNDNRALTNDGNSDLQPDLIWFKNRATTNSHNVLDSTRGVGKKLEGTDTTNAEGDTSTRLTSFDSDGFTVRTDPSVNGNTNGIVAWQWKANGGSSNASAAESGSNVAYNFQVNTTSKFMINAYTGTGSSQTLNLGNHFTPEFLIIKNRSQADSWAVYHHKNTADADTDYLVLDTTAATVDSADWWEDVDFAADEINLGTNHSVGADGENYICYAWAGVQGYSKFGSYTGNGAQDGTFVYTGFSPAFIMAKRTDAAKNWYIADSKRSPNNVNKAYLVANSSNAEDTSGDTTDAYFDILSNGFKLRQDFSHLNADGAAHVYMAFAEQPFVTSSGVPATAR